MHRPAAGKSVFMGAEIPFQLGITGGIGSGKSVFSSIFEVMGVPVYESDTKARKLYLRNDIREQVTGLMGKEAYLEDGKPDTAFIAEKMFGNPGLREALNAIIHPALSIHYRQWLEKQNHPYVLKVAALLFEADIARQLDFTAVVISPESLRRNRISTRDPHRSASQIEAILRSQWSDEEKIKRADLIVYNDEKHSLIEQAMQLQEMVLKQLDGTQ